MNNNIIAFGESNVRINNVDGEYWFCLKDVLAALGTKTRTNGIEWDDEGDTIKTYPLETSSGTQNIKFVSEAGLYELIGKVKSDKAIPFRRWVNHEVLPALRKNGSYTVPSKKMYGAIDVIPHEVGTSIDILKDAGFSTGIIQATLFEHDLAHYNETGSHFLPKKALDEAIGWDGKYSFNRSLSDDTKEAAIYCVADFNYLTVSELAKRYGNKKITSTLINKILEEGGYQKKVGKGKYIKTPLSMDIAVARKTESGTTKGLNIINGWRLNNSLEQFLNKHLSIYE